MAAQKNKKDTLMTRWLKSLRALNGLDQIELAEAVGVSRSLVAMWETGTEVQEEHIQAILEKYPDAPKLPDKDRRNKVLEVSKPGFPVGFPTVTMRYAGLVPTSDEWGDPLNSDLPWEVDAKFDHKDRFVCSVTGTSCYPALQQGDVTIWHSDLAPQVGKIVIAQNKGEHGCTVKELGEERDGRNILIPINPDADAPPDGEGWGVIARLVGVIFEDEEGSEVSVYRAKGISPKTLIRIRS